MAIRLGAEQQRIELTEDRPIATLSFRTNFAQFCFGNMRLKNYNVAFVICPNRSQSFDHLPARTRSSIVPRKLADLLAKSAAQAFLHADSIQMSQVLHGL